ncbi:NAD(P)-binding domain-containing protein [Kocuria salsicia]
MNPPDKDCGPSSITPRTRRRCPGRFPGTVAGGALTPAPSGDTMEPISSPREHGTTMRATPRTVGVTGLGAMGRPMTGHMVAAGHDVVVLRHSLLKPQGGGRPPRRRASAHGAPDGPRDSDGSGHRGDRRTRAAPG